MSDLNFNRRTFLRNSAIAAGALAAPVAFTSNGLLPTYKRQEWKVFRATTQYDVLINTIRKMKANTNVSDPASWSYWVDIHLNRCTHGVPYFLGWHRGYLYHFEKRLRLVSGTSNLVLPYWDYYSYATLPAEFTDPSNPLYVDRMNTNVKVALSMAPFSSDLINFQRGKTLAFEPSVEYMPHNTLHNIIGGVMADMQSPIDPVFWLHHANVDRLWVAWVAAGGGRKMPLKTDSYWAGNYTYNGALSLPRKQTYDTRTNLAYYYQNETMPTALPALAAGEAIAKMSAAPAVGTFKLSNPRATSASTFSAAGALQVELDERSVSVQLPAPSEYGQAIAQVAKGHPAAVRGTATVYKSVQVVLDQIDLTSAGGVGGYFYKIYVNVPARNSASATRSILIGTLGPFQIKAATNHGGGRAKQRFFITRFLGDISAVDVGMMTLSFERVNGERSPAGTVIQIGEARIELSTDEDES